MFDRSSPIILQAIGVVRSDFKEPTAARLDLKKIKAEIEIDPELAEALEGLVGFSHIIVLYWLHRAVFDKSNLKTYPMGNNNVPLQGLFAVRTLVLDIKPYIPGYDSASDATVPDWVKIEEY